MDESFLKFKKKIQMQTWIRCLSFGVAAAIAAMGVILLVCKLVGEANAYFYMLIGLVLLPLVTGILYFISRPTDERVALILDHTLSLQEKTRTMVAFQKQEGTIVSLQRDDVRDRLSGASLKRLRFHRLWTCILAVVLSCVLIGTAIFVPMKTIVVPEPPDERYEFDAYDKGLLQTLIREIREDELLVQTAKDDYVNVLETLATTMETVMYVSQKEQAVTESIAAVYAVAASVNTADEIAAVLATSRNDGVVALGTAINALNYVLLKSEVSNALDVITTTVRFETSAGSDIETLYRQFGTILAESELNKTDTLYTALMELADGLYASRNFGDNDAIHERFLREIEEERVTEALTEQAYTFYRAQYIEKTLKRIFGMNTNDSEQNKPNNPNQPNDEITPPDEVVDGPGGIGGGGQEFGSDELFYSPEYGYVSYGQLIDQYYNYALGLLEDGKIPKDFESFLMEYFNILYKGIPEDGESNVNKNGEKE